MLIVGAKGFAKEVLEVCRQNDQLDDLVFYDDVSLDAADKLYDTFPILKSTEEAQNYFKTINTFFTIGIGKPLLREKLAKKFIQLGGKLISTISIKADIGTYEVSIGKGCNILDGAKLSNSVTLGEGCIVYYNSIITHDCSVGNYVEISPNATILGRATVGDYCQLGSGCIILPDVKLGRHVIVGAGSVVTKDVPDNCTVVGTPARIIKTN